MSGKVGLSLAVRDTASHQLRHELRNALADDDPKEGRAGGIEGPVPGEAYSGKLLNVGDLVREERGEVVACWSRSAVLDCVEGPASDPELIP